MSVGTVRDPTDVSVDLDTQWELMGGHVTKNPVDALQETADVIITAEKALWELQSVTAERDIHWTTGTRKPVQVTFLSAHFKLKIVTLWCTLLL